MDAMKEYIFDVRADEFKARVIDASHTAVVVVDFWAAWCAPCKMLGPVLERAVSSFEGTVKLAKVNVDENQELAMEYAVRSIPSVKIFKDGSVVDEFVGVRPETEITAILNTIAGEETGEVISKALQLMDENRTQEAETLFRSVLANHQNHPGAQIGLARCAIKSGDYDRARELLESVGETEKEYDEALMLLSGLKFQELCENAGDPDELRKRFDENTDDLETGYALGCCYASSQRYEEALETFLTVLKKDSQFGNGKAKEAILSLFVILGQQSELTREYRSRLAMELF